MIISGAFRRQGRPSGLGATGGVRIFSACWPQKQRFCQGKNIEKHQKTRWKPCFSHKNASFKWFNWGKRVCFTKILCSGRSQPGKKRLLGESAWACVGLRCDLRAVSICIWPLALDHCGSQEEHGRSANVSMAGYSFAPEYWQTRHAALTDVVKQLGYPTLFITVAPYEWSLWQ